MTSAADGAVAGVRRGLAELADPTRAPQMQAYMKSALPYYGVRMPDVRRLTRRVFDEHRLADAAEWDATVRRLYDEATHREERYAALHLAAHRFYREYQVAAALPLYRHLVVEGAWWDLVDEAAHRVGDILLADRAAAEPVIRGWISEDVLWLRRVAIICQLGHYERTDLALLTDAVDRNLDDTDFFIRKAIGWALREYAKTDPAWVRRFVAERSERLAPLSRREALKNLH